VSAADACAACALCMGLRRRSPVTMSQTTIPTRWVRLCVRSARWQGVKQCAVHHAGLWAIKQKLLNSFPSTADCCRGAPDVVRVCVPPSERASGVARGGVSVPHSVSGSIAHWLPY
jgi:hypothetical protein